ncbi:MAG: CDP-glucose 4,6-dehydratase, partial [Verrucomicrobia bacterium]|nr:CDP-glucose 4,6-dehydratase [Verrucomicrobiota bacterium]
TVATLVEQIFLGLGGQENSWQQDGDLINHEASALGLDPSLAMEALPWRPRLNTEQTVAWTVQWYKMASHGVDMREFSLRQLDTYAALPALSSQ